ncbi:hypothetical protein COO60DRAFT_545387 [Scenedesmus sp. NREL 46B-D3]|nr:hypothetical protein COO60DRAFT_545387 [Scenedesmus sp. NREL 46B-D3]
MMRQLLRHRHALDMLCQLPAAARLSSDAVMLLLQAASQEFAYKAARKLCGLAAAQQLSSEQVETLLHACMQDNTAAGHSDCMALTSALCMASTCELPGAMHLSSHAVTRLLHTALTVDSVMYCFMDAEQLCRLPAATAISSADVASLLQAAFLKPPSQTADNGIEDLMHSLPAYSQLNSTQVAQLLRAAAERCCSSSSNDDFEGYIVFTSLCELPAAQQLSTEQVLQPLKVVAPHNARCTKALCQLPAAQQLSSEAVAQLLQAAVKGSSMQCFEMLSGLAAASSSAASQWCSCCRQLWMPVALRACCSLWPCQQHPSSAVAMSTKHSQQH